MTKLDVFRTVGRTFGFVIERRFFTLLRLIWLPTLASIVIGLLPAVYEFGIAGFPPDPEKLKLVDQSPAYWAIQALNFIASLILSAMIAVAVHRIILREDTQPGVYFYWRLTADEWRYIFAGIGYFILILGAFAAPIAAHIYYVATYEGTSMTVAAAQVVDQAKASNFLRDPRLGIAGFLSLLFGFAALARFGLVFPIVVAEDRLSFWRSWVLTRGNVMRLIGFWIVTVVLAYVLIMLVGLVGIAAVGAIVAMFIVGSNEVSALGVVVLGVPAAVSIAVYLVVGVTLFIAAMSFSYKELTEGDETEAA